MATIGTAANRNTGYTGLGNMDMLKSQILTMFALRNGNTEDGIFMAIWAIIMITCIDAFFRFIPVLAASVESLAKEYFKRRMNRISLVAASITPSIGSSGEEASIMLIRNYKDKDDTNKNLNFTNKDMIIEYELVDAVIEFICNQDSARHLRYTNKYYMNNTEPIQISRDITARMEHCDIDPATNQINSLTIRVSSTTLKISQMKEQLNRILSTYRAEKCNRLGGQKYYFNEYHIPPMPDMDGGFRWETAPKRITFNMTPFNTFKSINNIFGAHIAKIRERVDLFINNPEWYQQRGVPHTLGILLHGRPGCGKTSLIKAIARDTNRHVFNISLRTTTTQRQLVNLLFDENISITNAANETSTIAIPLDQRIYVIEDIDCMTDVVLDRDLKNKLQKPETDFNSKVNIDNNYDNDNEPVGLPGSMNTPIEFLPGMPPPRTFNSRDDLYWKMDTGTKEQTRNTNNTNNTNNANNVKKNNKGIQENKEEITLSFLLNLLDGVLETPNRILIITSNYPERLDKALVRPGRIDLNIHFDNADMEMILDMFQHFYNLTSTETKTLELDSKIDRLFTPAEIIAVLCNNYKNVADAVASLNNLVLSKINFNK